MKFLTLWAILFSIFVSAFAFHKVDMIKKEVLINRTTMQNLLIIDKEQQDFINYLLSKHIKHHEKA